MMLCCPVRLDVSALDASPLPLDLTLLKSHCAIDGDEFDDLLNLYALSAIAWAEGAMHRTIYARSHTWVLRDFPRDRFGDAQLPRNRYGEIRLPRGKTQSVESIAYSSGGSVVTLTGPSSTPAGTGYQEDLRGDDGGVILPTRASASWPSADIDAAAPVVISFTAGWEADQVPADIKHALMFAVSDAFEMRGEVDLTEGGRNLMTREALISGYRLIRWY